MQMFSLIFFCVAVFISFLHTLFIICSYVSLSKQLIISLLFRIESKNGYFVVRFLNNKSKMAKKKFQQQQQQHWNEVKKKKNSFDIYFQMMQKKMFHWQNQFCKWLSIFNAIWFKKKQTQWIFVFVVDHFKATYRHNEKTFHPLKILFKLETCSVFFISFFCLVFFSLYCMFKTRSMLVSAQNDGPLTERNIVT